MFVSGGGLWIMDAANKDVLEAKCKSIVLKIKFPKEQFPNSFITPGLCFKFNYSSLRKILFYRDLFCSFFPEGKEL